MLDLSNASGIYGTPICENMYGQLRGQMDSNGNLVCPSRFDIKNIPAGAFVHVEIEASDNGSVSFTQG